MSNKFYSTHPKYGFGFPASMMDGFDFDIFELANLKYTDNHHDAVWSENTWESLLEKTSAEIIELDEIDELATMSDTYYWVKIENKDQFESELRSILLKYLK